MSNEQLIAFWRKAQNDEDLGARLETAQRIESREESAAQIVRIAEEAGFRFTADDLEAVSDTFTESEGPSDQELSDDRLEHAAGGRAYSAAHFVLELDGGSSVGSFKAPDGGQVKD